MKRSPLSRNSGLQRRRTRLRGRRPSPRRREAPRWDVGEWSIANDALIRRSSGRCEICGTDRGPFERHHRKRRRDGGDRLSNLLYLCGFGGCHQHVTEHPGEARKFGWIVSVSRDPAQVPVLWRRKEWMTLHDDGTMTPAYGISDAHE